MGQLGIGLIAESALEDALSPVLVPPFALYSKNEGDVIRVHKIACGVTHSVVIDHNGSIWSWGARGRACLGHNDSVISNATKKSSMLTVEMAFSKQDEQDATPAELIAWVETWSKPRCISALRGIQFANVDAGEQHTTAMTTGGLVYTWGEGAAVPQNSIISANSSDIQTDGPKATTTTAPPPVVPVPRQCTRTWLAGLSTVHTVSVHCAGRCDVRMFCQHL